MKIFEVLLELSRKADNIIDLSNDFKTDIFKTVKEKALAIMACKTLKELKELSKPTEPEKKYKKFDIPFKGSKVHLHSNKSSLSSTSGISDQNNIENISELEKEDVANCNQLCNFVYGTNGQEFLDDNGNIDNDVYAKEAKHREEFPNRKFDSKNYQENSKAKNSSESNPQNFVKINNFHSSSVEISSEASTSKDINGIYSSTNLVYEKHRNINILEKIEENKKGIVSQKYVNVSTMIKTSYSKHSNGNFEEVNQNERDIYNENSYSNDSNNIEMNHGLSVGKLQTNVEKDFSKNIKYIKIISEKNSLLPCEQDNSNTDFSSINDSELATGSSGNRMPQNFQVDKTGEKNQIGICYLDSGNEVLDNIQLNAIEGENQLPTSTSCLIRKTVPDKQNVSGMKTANSKNFCVSSSGTESNSADNLKPILLSEVNDHVKPFGAKYIAAITTDDKQKKVSNKKYKISKNIPVVSAIPVLIENKELTTVNSKNVRFASGMKKNFNGNRASLTTNSKGYNLRSLKNNTSLRTLNRYSKKNSKCDFNKRLSLKEKIEEKKKIREQKLKLIRERRENLEKERKERLILNEERRMKRFEQHNEILKRKIMEVKNKAKRRKLSKKFTNSSEISPDDNTVSQSSERGLDSTYLVENLKDISPIEPTEKTQVRSSSEGLNHSLLYSSAYDKKIFIRQSVVLSDIRKLLPAGTDQNCLNPYQNKEVKPIGNSTSNCSCSKKECRIEIPEITKKNSAIATMKNQMRSTRKISVSNNNDKSDEVKKRSLSNNYSTHIKEGCKEISRKIDTQNINQNSMKDEVVSDFGVKKLAPKQTAKENDTGALSTKLQNDPELSKKSYVVADKPTRESVHTEIKILNEVKKVKAATLSTKIISSDPKLSVLTPVVVLKGTSNNRFNHSRLKNASKKTRKVSFLDNGIQNNPKLSPVKCGLVLKDITNSKSCIQVTNKKLENRKAPNNKKRKAQQHLNNKKPRKKPLVTSNIPENLSKRSSPLEENQSFDITSYELSDIGDNSPDEKKIAGEKPKKIPSWASNIHLKQALLKQHYKPQDTDAIFGNFRNQKAINIADIFTIDKPEYHNRTSSAKWSADESPI